LKNTSDKGLKKFKKDYPAVTAWLDYLKSKKLLTSYGPDYLENIWVEDGRIHSKFNQTGAETGRTSSENPNLQQVPKKPVWRMCFKARPGHKIGTCDLDGCELRIMAEASGERIWIEAFLAGHDLHMVVAFNVHEATEPGRWKKWELPGCVFAKS